MQIVFLSEYSKYLTNIYKMCVGCTIILNNVRTVKYNLRFYLSQEHVIYSHPNA